MGVLCKLNHSLTFLTLRAHDCTECTPPEKAFLILATTSHCMYSLVICHSSNHFTIFCIYKGKTMQFDLYLFSGSLGGRYFHGHGASLRVFLSLTKPKLRPPSRQRHSSTSEIPTKRIGVFVAAWF